MVLNREKGAPPLYAQLEQFFKHEIERGAYQYGDIFPGEKALMDQYEVSRITVRQAVGNLTQAGYLQGKRGIGTVVIYRKIDEHITRVISFSQEMQLHGIHMSTSYCEVDTTPASDTVAYHLHLVEGEECFRLVRVRCAEDKPVVYSLTYMPKLMNMPLDRSCYMDSLYDYLSKEKSIVVATAKDTFEASLATQEIADFLHIQKGDPVFVRTRKSYTSQEVLVEYTICYYPGDTYKYSIDL